MFPQNMEEITLEIRKTRKKYDEIMSRSGVSAFEELAGLESNALKSGALDQKHKELIALGISISQTCYG